MLKIKKGRFKELEKYGFHRNKKNSSVVIYEHVFETEDVYEYLSVLYDRKITGSDLDTLYDLIQAGLVEKVEG